MKVKCILIALITCAPLISAAGGWPQPKGILYLKLNQWWVISDQHYTNTGGIDPHLTRANYVTSIYSEYGITDRLTAIVYFPFFSRSVLNEQQSGTTGNTLIEGDAINSVGDTDLSIKYGLVTNKKIVLSTSLTLGIPLGNNNGGRDGSLQTGDGEFNQMLTFEASTSIKVFKNYYPFFTLSTGFNNRTNGFSDEFRYGAEAGMSIGKFTGIVRLFGIKSLDNGDSNFAGAGTSLFSSNTEYMSFSPELAFNVTKKVGISASYATAFSGRLIYANPSYSIGVFAKL